jgi:two-component system, LytTR family, response regulator AlgR
MRLVIVDDEPLARLRLRSLLDALPELGAEVVGEAGDAGEALALLQAVAADAVLLDIHIPGLTYNAGLRLAEQVKALARPPAVIFVTAYAEHALEAFEIEAVDYLTKPVRRERLLAALERVAQRLRGQVAADPGPVVVFSERGRVLRLPVSEVLYLKAELKYVKLHTAARSHVVDEPLSALEGRLGSGFIRVHRNALVARRAIRALELRGRDSATEGDGWAVRVAPLDEWIAVSRRQVAEVRAALADPRT